MTATRKASVSSASDCDEDSSNMTLPINRIAAEKLALLKSVDSWLKKSKHFKCYINLFGISLDNSKIQASIIYAGLEPLAFQELFPVWELHEDVRNINLKVNFHCKLNK